jgi:DNA-binding response OmpR family regulator
MTQVLLIEDDDEIRSTLAVALHRRGLDALEAATGLDGLRLVVDRAPDVIVLDLGLPDIDGSELLRMLRTATRAPVIVATARGDEWDIVRTLNAGADDYVVKPFSAEQIDARIRAVLRRSARDAPDGPPPDRLLHVGGLEIDTDGHRVTLDGHELDLSRKEFEILHYLAERVGTMVSKEELYTAIWRQPHHGSTKTVDTHLSWLRTKLGETANAPKYLHVKRGVGVRLEPTE